MSSSPRTSCRRTTRRSTVKVSPSTQIAQELQPRFLGGNPPDLIDNSGAQAIGFAAIIDQLEDMNSARRTEPRRRQDPRHARRWRRKARHVRRQVHRAQLRHDRLCHLVLGPALRGQWLDPADHLGRGHRTRQEGQGKEPLPLRLGQGSRDLLPHHRGCLGDQGRRRRSASRPSTTSRRASGRCRRSRRCSPRSTRSSRAA